MATVELVPLKHEHLVEFFGEDGRRPTVKGVAGMVDGELVGVGGVAIVQGRCFAFCDLKDDARQFKTAIHKAALSVMRNAAERHRLIIAECDPRETGAPRWLSRLGFKEQEEGRWIWRA